MFLMVIHASCVQMIPQSGRKQLKVFDVGIKSGLKRFKHYKNHVMERCTVGRNNAKPLWRVCGKWSMIRVVAEKLIKQK